MDEWSHRHADRRLVCCVYNADIKIELFISSTSFSINIHEEEGDSSGIMLQITTKPTFNHQRSERKNRQRTF